MNELAELMGRSRAIESVRTDIRKLVSSGSTRPFSTGPGSGALLFLGLGEADRIGGLAVHDVFHGEDLGGAGVDGQPHPLAGPVG